MASRRLFDGAQIELGLLPIVGAGAPPPTEITLAPARLDNANTFYSPTVSLGALNLTPSRLDNVNTFYSPTVSQAGGQQNVSPARLDNVNQFFTPKVDDGSSSNAGNFLLVRRRRRC
jgi:hypothetical protein